jgi:integrase
MPIVTLSAEFVRHAQCPEGKKKENYFCNSTSGFILETRCTGGMTYALRYKDQNGRQRQYKIGDSKSISFDQAKRSAQRIRSKVVLGEDPLAEKKIKKSIPTLTNFTVDSYLPFAEGYKREGSIKADLSMLGNHLLPRFGNTYLDKITQQEVIDFHQGMLAKGLAKGTANRGLVLLKHILNMALKWNVLGVKSNPAVGVKLFDLNNARERYLTPDETSRLVDAIKKSKNSQLKYIVPLLLLLGCRKHELIESRWVDFDLEHRTWRVPLAKSGKSRHVPLSKAVLEILTQLPRWENCPFVVPNPYTLRIFINIHRSWDIARKAAGLPEVRMHDLRHSMASNMVNSGRSIYEVAKVLGHSQLKTTQRYAHLSQETLLAAVDSAAEATGMKWTSK